MKINRHSIFLKLNLLFTIAIVSISIVFFIFTLIAQKRQFAIIFNDVRRTMRIVKKINPNNLPFALQEEGYKMIRIEY